LAYGGRYKGRRSGEPKFHPPSENDRTSMLNRNRVTSFRYAVREIMQRHEIEEGAASSIVASVIAKSSRISIGEAQAYVREQQKLGCCSPAAADEICDLLNRFTKFR